MCNLIYFKNSIINLYYIIKIYIFIIKLNKNYIQLNFFNLIFNKQERKSYD